MLAAKRTLNCKSIKLMVNPPISNTFGMIFGWTSFTGGGLAPWSKFQETNHTAGLLLSFALLFFVGDYCSLLNGLNKLLGFTNHGGTTLNLKLLTIHRNLLKLSDSLTVFTLLLVTFPVLVIHPFPA